MGWQIVFHITILVHDAKISPRGLYKLEELQQTGLQEQKMKLLIFGLQYKALTPLTKKTQSSSNKQRMFLMTPNFVS